MILYEGKLFFIYFILFSVKSREESEVKERVPKGFRKGSERVPKGFRKGSERVPKGFLRSVSIAYKLSKSN
jgi:hypothetical protein